jgi:hypothetical protein
MSVAARRSLPSSARRRIPLRTCTVPRLERPLETVASAVARSFLEQVALSSVLVAKSVLTVVVLSLERRS